MRYVRVAAAATSLLLLGAVTSLGSAGAATTGVGTAKGNTTVVHVALGTSGSLLDVRLLGDDSLSSVDTKTSAAPSAFSKLTAVRASSKVMNDPTTSKPLDLTLTSLESRQPGGQAEVTQSSVDLANPGSPVPAGLGQIISGNLNLAKLTSAADASSAKSALNASLTNAKVAGALLDAQAVNTSLAGATTSTETTSTRAVNVDALTVLDLGAVLDGLDISLINLTVDQINALLTTLKVPVPGLDPAANLNTTIDAIQQKVADLIAAVNSNSGLVNGTAGSVVTTLGLGGVIPTADIDAINALATPLAQTNALIDALQGALSDVLSSALSALDGTALLKLNGVDVSATTKAVDTVAGSSADYTGKIGGVTVGNLSFAALDLGQAVDTLNATVASVNDTLSKTLGEIKIPVVGGTVDLSKLVSVKFLQPTVKTVSTVNGYNTATAGITAVTASIKPPTDLAALVAGIKAQTVGGTSIASAIQGLGGTVPQLSAAMTTLETTLGTGVQALQDGANVNVVEVLALSEFKPSVTTTGTGTKGPLAATGAESSQLTALGLLLVALGLGLGRWFAMPLPAAWARRRYEI
ncbi:MAG: hypothetical protein QOI20_1461 [Acidimicrobiaceae bacterium]|nr:hypothetical protein [Acidimicrobiaceae bacterium]